MTALRSLLLWIPSLLVSVIPSQAFGTETVEVVKNSAPQPRAVKAAAPNITGKKGLTFGGRWLLENARLSALPLGLNKSGEQVVADGLRPSSNHFRAQLQGQLLESLELEAALDVYQWSEPTTLDRTAADLTPVDLRTLHLAWTTAYGRFKLGRTENRWGLGMVAGGRSASPSWTYPFDQPARGDNVLLAAYGAKLGNFVLAISGQQVLDDENTTTPVIKALTRDLSEADEAYQGGAQKASGPLCCLPAAARCRWQPIERHAR